ncbi:SO2930 family diheme c-type cytochrome [Negadavirga shengliensis]|uniref:SO2930 family diheme c-type cytochrome n=1 Tax=Negadavirga shengliensis TaxID=1389218 RepID=A0ABV9SYC1_9BACT
MDTFRFYIVILTVLLGVGACKQKNREIAIGQHSHATETPEPDYAADINKVDLGDVPFRHLSEYGFFDKYMRELNPKRNVVPYAPSSALFSDYAYKARFIWMPENAASRLVPGDMEGKLEFPDNTVLIKNFYYPEDFRKPDGKRKILETRLIIKRNGLWEAFPYIWNEDQTDATYKVVGAEMEVKWTDKTGRERIIKYIVPNKNQCKSCHNENEKLVPIGLKAKYLDHALDYGNGPVNQLSKWQELGILDIGEEEKLQFAPVVDYEDEGQLLHNRARAYLDINCAPCHREEGPAGTSGLFLNYEEKDANKLGVFKTPVAAGFGAGPHKFSIFPGKADESIMVYRMASTEVGVAMPEIGRSTVHVEGLELIKEWINSLQP